MPTAEQKAVEEEKRLFAEALNCNSIHADEESRTVLFVARKKGDIFLAHPVTMKLSYEQLGGFLGSFLPIAMKPVVVAAPGPSSTPRFQ